MTILYMFKFIFSIFQCIPLILIRVLEIYNITKIREGMLVKSSWLTMLSINRYVQNYSWLKKVSSISLSASYILFMDLFLYIEKGGNKIEYR